MCRSGRIEPASSASNQMAPQTNAVAPASADRITRSSTRKCGSSAVHATRREIAAFFRWFASHVLLQQREITTTVSFNSRLGVASTYAGLMSPPGGESPMGLRSVRFDSGLHGRVCVVCLFCAREPPCSHLAPCGLFVSAPGARHTFALGGMAPKFFRWIHCLPRRRSPRPQR